MEHGGNFVPPSNFLKEESLDYLIEAATAEMFGKKLYPEITDVAALYFHSIISNHIFQDGNKRTGLLAALTFLNLNGFQIIEKRSVESLIHDLNYDFTYDFTLNTAAGKISLDECRAWFKKNVISL